MKCGLFGADTLEQVVEGIENSETIHDSVYVHDLETGEMLEPVLAVSHFVGPKGVRRERDGSSATDVKNTK
jgi:hypothetical protein